MYLLCFLILGGYLPLNHFQWNNLNGKASHRYISARCYTTNSLCRWFGGMNRDLLPLCAVLIGNDYGAPKDMETLLDLLDVNMLGRGCGRGKSRAPASRIEGLLHWLSSFSSSAEALAEVSRLLGEDGSGRRGGKGGLSSQLWAGMQEYHITPQSSLACWFSGGKAPGGQNSQLVQLPECLLQAAAQGLLGPLVVDALVMRRVLLIPQVENSKLPSSHCIARTIRQAIYGILLQRVKDDMTQGKVVNIHGLGSAVLSQDIRVQENITQGARGGKGRGGRGQGRGGALPTQQCVNVGYSIEHATSAARVQTHGSSTPMCVEEFDRLDLTLKKNQEEAYLLKSDLCLDSLGLVNMTTK